MPEVQAQQSEALTAATAKLEEWQGIADRLLAQLEEAQYKIAFYQGKIEGIMAVTADSPPEEGYPAQQGFTAPFAKRK